MFQACLGGESNLLSRSHVSSMTGGCTCPIYYQEVVSAEKGSVIIRYKKNLAELIKKRFLGGEQLSCSLVSSMTRRGVEHCFLTAMFQA